MTSYLFTLLPFNVLGIGCVGCSVPAFVMAVEYSGKTFRTYLGMAFAIPFAIGELILGLEAYYVRDWFTLQVAALVPWIILIPVLWILVPESPCWLISMGRYK